MNRSDPFLDSILSRLDGRLDPDLFERCACEILQADFPGLVPIPGGNDLGMDGAIADGQGEAFPLVVTTAQYVSRNLRQSLDRYAGAGGERRRVVLATSRHLTATRRRNLEELARERAFTLVQIVAREGIASRLYRHPEWCSRLLGLPGELSALSAIPPSARALVEIEPIAREKEIAWLREVEGDLLLVGQPGSGKTFLLYQLARVGEGLFLAGSDPEAIASAIREQSPPAILVDDAHVDPERLVRLRHHREQSRASFRIIASTWPAARDDVRSALGDLAETQIQSLEGLTRNEIVAVYRSAGVNADEVTLRDLVDQASNQPGLAMTLAQIFLRGEWNPLFTGQALRRSVCTIFDRLIGKSATPLLATFALGGNGGLLPEAASEALKLPVAEVVTLATELSSGGVLEQVPGRIAGWRRALRVRPDRLRTALIAEVFFGTAANLPLDTVLDRVEMRDGALKELLDARARGVDVPDDLLWREVQRSQRSDLWRWYASLGKIECQRALQNFPGDLTEVLEGALLGDAELALTALLELACQRDAANPDEVDRLLQPLRSWLKDIHYQDWEQEAIRRRKATVQAAIPLLSCEAKAAAGVAAICLALRPEVEYQTLDPGLGDRVTLHYGRLSTDGLRALAELRNRAFQTLPPIDGTTWRRLSRLVDCWSRPGQPIGTKVERRRQMQTFAAELLARLAGEGTPSVGLASALSHTASRLDLVDCTLDVEPDPTFELIFGESVLLSREQTTEHEKNLDVLSEEWARRSPEEILPRFRTLWTEAVQFLGPSQSRWNLRLWPKIARQVDSPETWLELALELKLPPIVPTSFLRSVAEARPPDWQPIVETSMGIEATQWTAAEIVLRLTAPPERLLGAVIERAARHLDLLDLLSLRRELPLPTLRRLLRHENWRVATVVAIGEWKASEAGGARTEVEAEWTEAILRARPSDSPNDQSAFWLRDILASDPALAFDWLTRRLGEFDEDLPWHFVQPSSPAAAAIGALDHEQRSELLDRLIALPGIGRLCAELVGEDVELYRRLLGRDELSTAWLDPLETLPTEAWARLALDAVKRGLSPGDVARASFTYEGLIAGSGVEHWRGWLEAFQELSTRPERELQEISARGIALAEVRIQDAEERWRQVQREGF